MSRALLVKGISKLDDLGKGFVNAARGMEELNLKVRPHFTSHVSSLVKNEHFFPSEGMMMKSFSSSMVKLLDDVNFVKTGDYFKPQFKNIDIPFENVVADLRMGNLEVLIDALKKSSSPTNRNVAKTLDNAVVKNTFKNFAEQTFPDQKFYRTTETNATWLKKRIGEDIFDQPIESIPELLENNKMFRTIVNRLEELPKKQGKKMLYIKSTFGVLVLGGGAFMLCDYLTKQAEERAGCWRVYQSPKGDLIACKLTQCSCAYNRIEDSNLVCTKVPQVIENKNVCQGWPNDKKEVKGAQCRRCDIHAPIDSPQYLPPEEMIAPTDLYVCKEKPSLGKLLSEFISKIPTDVWDNIHSGFNLFAKVLKYCVCFVLGGLVLYIIIKLRDIYKQIKYIFYDNYEYYHNEDDDDDDEKDGTNKNRK